MNLGWNARVMGLVAAAWWLCAPAGQAADGVVRVICTNIIKGAVVRLFPEFEKATGKRVVVTYGASAALKREIEAGAEFDLALLTSGVIDELIQDGHIRAGTRTAIARSDLAVATRVGARKSNVSTAAGMKQRLIEAKSITYSKDGGGAAAVERMLATLGVPRERVFPQAVAGHAAESAAAGDYEIAFAPLGEIVAVPGTLVLGLFPPEFQNSLEVSSGISAKAADAEGARELARFLMTPASMKTILASGMSPLPKR